MTVYRVVPLAVSSVILLALFGTICWLALTGSHDMQVAVISFVTGVGVIPAVSSLGHGLVPAHAPPTGDA